MNKKVVGYIRFSTLEQKKGYGKDIQKRDIKLFATARVWMVDRFYIDEALSGAEENRAELNRLIRACEAGKIKAVIVASLSRFARSVRFAENFFYELDQLGVMVCFADMPHYDGANRKDIMARQFNEAIAEEQRVSIIEQLRKGREARAWDGKISGGTVPYGYIRLEVVEHKRRAKRVKINREEAHIVRLIFDLHDQGRSNGQTARVLNKRGYRRRNSGPWMPQQVRPGKEQIQRGY